MKYFLFSLFMVLAIGFGFYIGFSVGKSRPIPVAQNTYGDFEANVSRTRDGDTAVVSVENEEEPVRYIGIDTPETKHPVKGEECFGKEAAEKNKALVYGKSVRLERDKSNRDQRGRLLRYAWLDGKMVNLELVESGYAFASHVSPNGKYRKLFEDAETKARSAGIGLWKDCKALVSEHDGAKEKIKRSKPRSR